MPVVKDSDTATDGMSSPPPSAAVSKQSPPLPQQEQQQQQARPSSAMLEQCLKLLKGKSDEHKFAGLVMVTKHVPALTAGIGATSTNGSTGTQDQLRQICDAVGAAFVHRLLKTEGGGGNGTSGGGGAPRGLSVYQQIALGVLAAFLQDESLVRIL